MRLVSKLLVLTLTVTLLGFGSQLARAQEFSREIEVLGFKFTVEDGEIAIEEDKLVLKGKSHSLFVFYELNKVFDVHEDVESALAAFAVKG